MPASYGGLTAFPETIEEGLAVHGYVAPKARVYAAPKERGAWVGYLLIGSLTAAFVGLILIPYVQRVGGAGGAGCACGAQSTASDSSGWPWLA